MPFPSVTAQEYVLQAMERMYSRILVQFRQSPVFLSMLQAFADKVQALSDQIIATIEKRTVPQGMEEQLDVIGRIVGQTRELLSYETAPWLTPDVNYRSIDQTPVWVVNAPLGGNLVVGDMFFRQLIEGKIYRNFSYYGSVPEIQAMVKAAFGIDVSVVRSGPLAIYMVVPDSTGDSVIQWLKRTGESVTTELPYYLPIAATVYVTEVYRYSDRP